MAERWAGIKKVIRARCAKELAGQRTQARIALTSDIRQGKCLGRSNVGLAFGLSSIGVPSVPGGSKVKRGASTRGEFTTAEVGTESIRCRRVCVSACRRYSFRIGIVYLHRFGRVPERGRPIPNCDGRSSRLSNFFSENHLCLRAGT